MSNIYLEKIASTAALRNLGRGLLKSVTGVDRAGNAMAASSLNKSLTGATQTAMVRTPATRMRQMPSGLKYMSEAAKPARAVETSDVLARSSVRERLAASQAAKAAGKVAPAAPTKTVFGTPVRRAAPAAATQAPAATNTMANMKIKGTEMFNKAKQLSQDHPKAAIGVAGAGLAAGGYAAGRSDNNNNNY